MVWYHNWNILSQLLVLSGRGQYCSLVSREYLSLSPLNLSYISPIMIDPVNVYMCFPKQHLRASALLLTPAFHVFQRMLKYLKAVDESQIVNDVNRTKNCFMLQNRSIWKHSLMCSEQYRVFSWLPYIIMFLGDSKFKKVNSWVMLLHTDFAVARIKLKI